MNFSHAVPTASSAAACLWTRSIKEDIKAFDASIPHFQCCGLDTTSLDAGSNLSVSNTECGRLVFRRFALEERSVVARTTTTPNASPNIILRLVVGRIRREIVSLNS